MRTILMLTFLLIAGPCLAEDPLETLNTVEDTLSAMGRSLDAQAAWEGESAADGSAASPGDEGREGDLPGRELYFVSDEPLGAGGCVAIRPCPGESGSFRTAASNDSCANEADDGDGYLWGSRAAGPADLRPGVAVAAHQGKEGIWFMARITDVSELRSGYVAVSAPFKFPVQGLRVIEE